MPLLSLLATNPAVIRQLHIEQIVSNCGDGRLRDGSESQSELREYLRQTSVDSLAAYSEHCLTNSFLKSGQVLQDIVNELGRRLEYEVVNGRYQGTPKDIGYDGIWRDPSGHALVLEVKTTDAYRLSLDTVAGYRDKLISAGDIQPPCSILIVVGRTDTGELEAQVRGSRHAWDMRMISIDALLNLVRVKESTDVQETVAKIRRLLTPLEYTRLDALVDVVFTTTRDVEYAVASESEEQEPEVVAQQTTLSKADSQWEFTPSDVVQSIREEIVAAFGSRLKMRFIKKSRALHWSPDQKCRIACTVSKRYDDQGIVKYWYAYHPRWHEFLEGGETGYFILSCTDLKVAFALPSIILREHLDDFYITERKDGGDRYWHIKLVEDAGGLLSLQLPHAGVDLPLKKFQFQWNDANPTPKIKKLPKRIKA